MHVTLFGSWSGLKFVSLSVIQVWTERIFENVHVSLLPKKADCAMCDISI